MTARAVIDWATSEGLTLEIRHGRIVWRAAQIPPYDLLERLRDCQQEVLNTLRRSLVAPDGITDTLVSSISLNGLRSEISLVSAWLDFIGECDPVARALVMDHCQASPGALAYVASQAALAGIDEEDIPQGARETAASGAPDPFDGLPLDCWDRQFFARLAARMSPDEQASLQQEYSRRWREASSVEPVGHRKDNAGRRAANTWLREFTGYEEKAGGVHPAPARRAGHALRGRWPR